MTHENAEREMESMPRFSDLNISAELKQGVKELGYITPTDFQKGVFDNFQNGKNVLGEGQSNYGKSLAFSLPILAKVDPKNAQIQALIICESSLLSELCAKECRALGRHLGINVSTVVPKQNETLPQILVLSVDDVTKIDTGLFYPSLHTVFFDGLSIDNAKKVIRHMAEVIKKGIQVLVFGHDTVSAFRNNANDLIDSAILISNNDQPKISLPAKHIYVQPKEAETKPSALLSALEVIKPKTALVTCNETQECELLARYLARYGYRTKSINDENRHDVSDSLREIINGSLDILVCPNSLLSHQSLEQVAYMFNYDMFDRPQSYEQVTQFNKQAPGLQRCIVNLLTSRELGFLGPIKAQCLIDFKEIPLPSEEEVMDLCATRIRDALNKEASEVELLQFEILAQKIFSDKSAQPALALLLRNHFFKAFAKSPKAETHEGREYKDRRGMRSFSDRRRPDRKEREPFESPSTSNEASAPRDANTERSVMDVPEGITRLYVTLGRRDGLYDLASLAQYLSEQSGVDLGHFSGSGMIRDTSAHIEVDSDVADEIIAAIHETVRPQSSSESSNQPNQEDALVICERAKQAVKRHFRRPPGRRKPHFQRRS